MKSPFPGMDPYLEDPAFWPDFHSRCVNAWCEQIADVLPDHYEARLGENIYLCEEVVETEDMRKPDLMVLRSKRRKRMSASPGGGVATVAPVIVPLTVLAQFRQVYVKLIHRPTRAVVAVLELLSPANKNEPGKREYSAKRNELIRQNVHIVELDLLLNGQRLLHAEPLPRGDYYYLVSRANRRPDCEVYAWNADLKLPTVPVPLQVPDADVFCDLSKVVNTAYQRGRYHQVIDYRSFPLVKLTTPQKQWIRRRVRAAKA